MKTRQQLLLTFSTEHQGLQEALHKAHLDEIAMTGEVKSLQAFMLELLSAALPQFQNRHKLSAAKRAETEWQSKR